MGASTDEMSESSSQQEMEVMKEDNILDLTGSQLHSLKDVEIATSLRELDLTANRFTVLDDRIAQLSQLRVLSLRQNLFEDAALEVLARWTCLFSLQELVLRDNRLTKVPLVTPFPHLTILDVSFNKLSSMEGIANVPCKLRELYLTNNEIAKIVEVEHLQELRVLELGSNKIREMEGLESLPLLKELWLGRNRIRSVELSGLSCLTIVSIQSNRLTSMLGFQECLLLEELYLSHNFISIMEGLSTLTKLRVLDVSSNKIECIKDIESLSSLEDLWLNDNSIPTLDGIEIVLAGVKNTLTTIYLERNPCAMESGYLRKLRGALPHLVQVDATFFDPKLLMK